MIDNLSIVVQSILNLSRNGSWSYVFVFHGETEVTFHGQREYAAFY